MSIWAIIPARGGSKGLPGKNLALLNGKPLISYAIESALKNQLVDRVFVSSDDNKILSSATLLGAETVRRPSHLAEDHTLMFPVIEHVLQTVACEQKLNSLTIVLLQPTSPLRTANHVKEAIALFLNRRPELVISVYQPDVSPLKSLIEDKDGYLHGIVDDKMPFRPRQELPKAFYPNGAIYVFNAESCMQQKAIPMTKCLPYIMESKLSIDIDTSDDLREAEKIMKVDNE